jgi:hypothetical protein
LSQQPYIPKEGDLGKGGVFREDEDEDEGGGK